MWDLNIKFCPKFRLICIAQNYAHLCKYIIFKNNNFFFKVHVFCYHYNKTQTARNQFDEMKYMYYTVIVFNKGTYVSELLSKKLWSHSRVPTGSHHNSIIFSENRYFFYIFGMYMYIFMPMAIYHQECMYIFVIMLKVLWNVHLINCISQKMFHSFSVFFNINTCTSLNM